MVDFFIPRKSKVIISIKRHRIRSIAQGLVTTVPEILDLGVAIPRLGTITPLEWDVSWGVTGIITQSIRYEIYMTLIDIDNLPQIAGIADRAIWSSAQFWQFNTGVGITQMLQREIQDFFNPASFTFTERADFTQRLSLAIIGLITNANEGVDTVGVLTYQEELIQRVFGNDNASYETDNGDWEDFGSDEDDEDND